jgi:hypothetical protein
MYRFMVSAAVLALAATLAGGAAARNGDGVWVDGKVHGLVTGLPKTSNPANVAPLYVIAPVDAAHPLHALAAALTKGFGAHDHVLPSVLDGPCDITLVVPGAKAGPNGIRTRATLTPAGNMLLVYAARVGGRMEPLTSVSTIAAAAKAGLVKRIDTHTVLSCKVVG